MTEDEGEIYNNEKKETTLRPKLVNPPSEVLYLTMVTPQQEGEIREKCHEIGVKIYNMQWNNHNNRWSCLANFGIVDHSLLVMGLLQN
jgi:hypothetical protein